MLLAVFGHCDFVSYEDATAYCKANYPNGNLAAPAVQSEFSAVQNEIKSACHKVKGVTLDFVWIGFFIDENTPCYGPTTFISVGTCEPLTADQINFASGQPDGAGAEKCVGQGVTNGGGAKLHDYPCATTLPFVCQVFSSTYEEICDGVVGKSCPPPPFPPRCAALTQTSVCVPLSLPAQ